MRSTELHLTCTTINLSNYTVIAMCGTDYGQERFTDEASINTDTKGGA